VLSDGQLSFTPGIGQTLGTPNGSGGMSYASHFYAEDGLGNLRGMSDGGGQGFPDAYNWDAFGQLIGRAGGTSTPFGYGEGSGYQTDGDSGLRLLGHRYYDSRTGRFISQDPAGAGGNWYAYCDNNPVSGRDPSGLDTTFSTGLNSNGSLPSEQQIQEQALAGGAQPGDSYTTTYKGETIYHGNLPAGSILSFQGYHLLVPPGVSISNNINRASLNGAFNPAGMLWFRNQVRNNKDRHLPLTGGNASWDYKQLNSNYGSFGNFNFGAGAAAMADQNNWTQEFVLRMAGAAQVSSGTSKPGWGSPGNLWNPFDHGTSPYGDDPADQALIKAGWNYYFKHPAPEWP